MPFSATKITAYYSLCNIINQLFMINNYFYFKFSNNLNVFNE